MIKRQIVALCKKCEVVRLYIVQLCITKMYNNKRTGAWIQFLVLLSPALFKEILR